jgi:O-antigen/teichoic acid export membrane protein
MAKESNLNINLKRLVKSSIIVFIGLFLSKLLFYGYRIVIARYLGPEIYGFLSVAIMVSGWFIAVSSVGLADGILRYVALARGRKEIQEIKYIFKFALLTVFSLSIISGIILFFSSEFISIHFFHNPSLILFLKIFSFTIPLTIISYILLAVIKAYEKIGTYSFILNVLQNFVKLIFLAFFIYLGLHRNAVTLSYLIGTLAMLFAAYFVCRRISDLWGRSILNPEEKTSIRKSLLHYSWPLMFFALVTGILPSIDSMSLGYFKDIITVGIYNAAVPFAMLLNFAAEIFMQLFFPLITREYSRGNIKLIRETSKQIGKWVFMINLPVIIVMIIFPGTIINFFFGPSYITAENPLRILAIGIFFSGLFMVSDNLIAIIGKSKLNLLNVIFASLINILLNIILIPKFGMDGAAYSTLIAMIIWAGLRGWQSYYYLKILPLRRKMLRILIVSLIPTSILILIKDAVPRNPFSLIILGGLFILSYVLLLFLTKCFDKNDWMIINTFKRKIFGQ